MLNSEIKPSELLNTYVAYCRHCTKRLVEIPKVCRYACPNCGLSYNTSSLVYLMGEYHYNKMQIDKDIEIKDF